MIVVAKRGSIWEFLVLTVAALCFQCPPPLLAQETGFSLDGGKPTLRLGTRAGPILIELDPEAAPSAVKKLIQLAEGPVFASELTADSLLEKLPGYYDGLLFDQALKHHFLKTALRPPAGAMLIRMEIDADSLGLDQRVVEKTAEAMEIWQREIIPYWRSQGRAEHPLLKKWLEEWSRTHRADFLLGISRKSINEVLGFHYKTGLISIPVRRGTVSLQPFNTKWATPALCIHLNDRPDQDGRLMVVGKVVKGLENVEKISEGRLIPARSAGFRLVTPIRIDSVTLECRPSDSTEPKQDGGK